MLCGVMEQTLPLPAPRRGLTARAVTNGKWRLSRRYCQRVVVAGAITARLAGKLYCADEAPALGASGNRQGARIRS